MTYGMRMWFAPACMAGDQGSSLKRQTTAAGEYNSAPSTLNMTDAGSKSAGRGSTGFDPARIIQDHQAGVWRYLRALGCDPHQASDLTQDAFLAVLQKPFRQYSDAATAAYLRKVAYNLFISWKRRSGRVLAVEDLDRIDAQWSRWAGEDQGELLLESLKACLQSLGEKPLLALELRYREQQSRAEIAQALQMTENGAKNVLQRAKKKLRACIQRKLKP